jgi:Tol biopolymer transport system component
MDRAPVPRRACDPLRPRPAVSPSGRHVAFLGANRLAIVDLSTGKNVSLTGGAGGHAAAWSPCGRRLAVVSRGQRAATITIIEAR